MEAANSKFEMRVGFAVSNLFRCERLTLGADSSGRRNTYYKLSMWSDDYDKGMGVSLSGISRAG